MSLGGSFGISMLNTSISNSVANHASRLSEQIGVNSKMFTYLSRHMTQVLGRRSPVMPPGGEQYIGLGVPISAIYLRAQVLGFQDAFVLSGLIFLLAIPLCLMLKPGFYQEPAKV
jgi:hypothetical protein